MNNQEKILEVRNLRKYFNVGTGKNKLVVPAVDNVSFDIHKGEVFGLVGESGCGKTTTGRTIIRLYKPTDGSVKLNGETLSQGIAGCIYRIKKLKKQAKIALIYLDEEKTKLYELDQELENFLKEKKNEKQLIVKNFKELTKKNNEDIDTYRNQLYNRKNSYLLKYNDIIFRFNINKKEIFQRNKNIYLVEYKKKLSSLKFSFNRKKNGLLNSNALEKDAIKKKVEELKKEYDVLFSNLKVEYENNLAKNNTTKEKRQSLIKYIFELINNKNKEIQDAKAEYKKSLEEILVPNFIKIKENKKSIIAEKNSQISKINKEINNFIENINQQKNQIKASYKKIRENTEKSVLEEQKAEYIKKSNVIKNKLQEDINIEKAEIKKIRHIFTSKEIETKLRKMQMIFQDPISSLNPRMTVGDIVGEGLIIQKKYSKEEIITKVRNVLELVGLSPDYISRYPHEFSGGQRQRIGVARALIMEPDFIIADEPISALDVSIRAQVINLLSDLREKLGLTILFIAHDLSVVRFFCDTIAVMYYGKIVEKAPTEVLFNHPLHPYTKSLLSAIPQPDPDYEKGRVRICYDPTIHDYNTEKPELVEIEKDHFVLCNSFEKEEYSKVLVNEVTR